MLVVGVCRSPLGPGVLSPGGLLEVDAVVVVLLHIEIGRKVAVVVRSRVLGIVPVERGVTVVTASEQDSCVSIELVGRGVFILQGHDRLEGVAHAGVAHLAVLVTPVGVVHIVTHKVIDFLGGCVLCTALSRGREGEKGELVLVVEPLADAGIEGEVAVIHTLNPVVSAESGGSVEGIGPAVVQLAGGVARHQAEAVEGGVGEDGEPPAGADGGRDGADVGDTVVPAHAEVRRLEAEGGVLGAHCLIQAAPQGERRVSGDGVVHRYAGQIHVLGLGVVAAVLETYVAEAVADHVGVDIVGAEQDGRGIGVAAVLEVEFREVGGINVLTHAYAADSHEHKVAHQALFHRHVDGGSYVFRGLYGEAVFSVREVFEAEASVRSRGGSPEKLTVLDEADECARNRSPAGAVYHRSLDAAVISGCGGTKGQEGRKYE